MDQERIQLHTMADGEPKDLWDPKNYDDPISAQEAIGKGTSRRVAEVIYICMHYFALMRALFRTY